MSPEERQMLTALFDRVRTASATPRDREAEELIERAVREQPYATYYLAQAVIVQEKGLEAAANHIKELEERVRQLEADQSAPRKAEQGGGFLSSIFGGQSQQPAANPPVPAAGPWGSVSRQDYQTPQRNYDEMPRQMQQPVSAPWNAQQAAPSAGGSFLRGALGTAAGVAGGMLLANSLSSIFSNHTSSLGWGSPFSGANPFGASEAAAPVEETVINNNYYGDDAIRDASSGDDRDGGIQQADYDDDQPDFDNGYDDDDSSLV
ncbi:DUF2076 domain-containing protein [Oryzifoliimicrobium ureilyticus]|uniref:DUF2076 domain-containing protein n=1 Tax=Oryzifoliimicrobium ureilyticus TaxID=3113724 RepID=UPI0030761F43